MRQLCFLLAFLFVGLLSSAQINYFNFEDALINDNVRSLEQDINGNVWIGTIAGITRFDGTSFTSFTSADGLGGNIIYDICAHSSGDVYAATSGGLSVFNGSVWTNYTMGDGLPSNTIWSVEEDNANQIWVGTSDMGVSYFDGVNWNPLSVGNGLISAGVKVIFADRNNNIWFGTGNGLSMYDGSTFKNFNTSTGLPGLLINDIIQLYNGNIAIATNGGLGVYNFSSWTSITTAQGLPTANILALRQDYAQNLWMGASLGLIKYDWSSFTTHNYNDGLVNDVVSKIIITEAGDNKIWAASPFNGLTVFDQADTYIIYRTNKNLADDHVNTIYTDDENITWVGTQNGLNRVDNLHWRTYRTGEGLTVNDITAIHKDINDNIWVGTTGGLNLLNGATFDQITVADGLTNNNIYSITSDDAGVVYVATADKVNVIDAGVVIDTLDMTDGLLSNVVKQVHFENGRVWYIQDAAIQYFDGSVFVDVTSLGCPDPQTAAGAKCLNNSLGQYFGTDYTLTYYDIDNSVANCVLHPYAGVATMTSAVEFGPAIVCAFDNGEIQSFNGGWTPDVLPFDVSFIEQSYNNEYMWIGSVDQGLAVVHVSNTDDITYLASSPTCHESSNGTITITNPIGAFYSVDYGENWQASNVFNSETGGYKHLLVKNAFNQIIADSVIFLDYYDIIDDANITISQILCNGNNDAQIQLAYSNPGAHEWWDGNTTLYLREYIPASTYSVTVTDGIACNRVLENEIISPDILDVAVGFDDVNCFGEANGTISLTVNGGTIPYDYNWNTGDDVADLSGLIANDYFYTVTDANGCEVSGMQEVSEPDELFVSGFVENNGCYGELNGGVDISWGGGTADYLIEWNNSDYVDGNNDVVLAPAGDYIVTITDDHGCTVTESFEITQPNEIEIVSEDIVNVLCHGEETGEITLTTLGGTGVLSFEWVLEGEAGVFATTEDLIELAAGIYHLTVNDENMCELTSDYTITQSDVLDVTLDVTPISCAGYENGEILAQATGGSGTYSAYYWYDDEENIIGVSPHITGLSAGYYEVVVRDSYYCYDTAFTTLTQATPHVYSITPTDMSCNGNEDGEIVVTVDGGPGVGYTFEWQDDVAGNVNVAQGLGVGEYSVTVTDPTSCEEILSTEINQPYMQEIGAFNDVEYLCYGNDLVLNPGTFASYSWNTGSDQPTITVENEDVYFVEVVDASGCHLGDTVQVIISTVYNNEEINLASVTDDETIKIMWEKTPGQGTERFNIYRDSGDGFEFLASKLYNEVAIYEDTDVSTSDQYYKYQITAVDSCGSESDYSTTHRTCLLDVVPDGNGACWLNWGEYQGFFVVYYFIMSGTSPDNMEVVDSTLYNDFNWVEMNPNPNGTYYQIKVRRIDGCSPGDGEYYDEAFSNIVFCDNYVGFVNTAVVSSSVYPNPFSYKLNLEINLNIPGEIKYSFINLLGQQVVEPQVFYADKGEQVIEINPEIAPGIYVLRVEFNDEVYNLRVVKENY
ncbi:MAG: T9SS type A sorting domain-containing protein [Bacteroidales bacterium]|nr:T9SS type A sorting domain-containing protein [Bacteroidales bacterium]